jgi:hypothetical protein
MTEPSRRIGRRQLAIVTQSRRKGSDIDVLLLAVLDLRQSAALPLFNMLAPFDVTAIPTPDQRITECRRQLGL